MTEKTVRMMHGDTLPVADANEAQNLLTAFFEAFGIADAEGYAKSITEDAMRFKGECTLRAVGYLTAAIDYAESYQHREPEYYDVNAMSASTRQAVLLLASHFYESRDGSTAGFFGDGVEAERNVWKTVNALLDMGKEWVV